jgi:hypothetical protein
MAKKKLKKLLKGAGMVGAALLGAQALKRRNQMKKFLATEGGDKSDMRDYGPFSRGPGFVPNNPMTPQDMANDPMFQNAMAAKGGVIVKTEKGGKAVRRKKKIGIQIKGFGKARRS